jgi:hypothetical protein
MSLGGARFLPHPPLPCRAGHRQAGPAGAQRTLPIVRGGGQPVKTPEFEGRVEGEKGAMKEFIENSTKHYDAAQNLMGRLTTMDHNIETLGPKWMGAGANAKGEFGKQWNGLLDTAGVKGYHIDPTKIATWEEFNKESARAGMELINANFDGSREAASIIKMGTEAVPAAQQTYLGATGGGRPIPGSGPVHVDHVDGAPRRQHRAPARRRHRLRRLCVAASALPFTTQSTCATPAICKNSPRTDAAADG